MCLLSLHLQWLTEVFLPYLDELEDGVNERPGFTKTQKGMMLLSRETRMGLKITGLLLITTNFYLNCESNDFIVLCLFEVTA